MCDANRVSEKNGDSQTPGVKTEISGVDAEIAVVAWVLDESLVDIPVYGDINNTSDEYNIEIDNCKEYHNK